MRGPHSYSARGIAPAGAVLSALLVGAALARTRRRRAELRLPAPRPFSWELHDLSTARTQMHRLPDGRLRLAIDHGVLRGVTPEMLRWWFLNIGGTMEHEGEAYPRYLVWHPWDHIRWDLVRPAPNGSGAGPGARVRIVEAFGRDPKNLVDVVVEAEKVDDTGVLSVYRVLSGLFTVFHLEHRFVPEGDLEEGGGTRYLSEAILGSVSPLGRLLINRLVVPRLFPEAKARAWFLHNVEEVGNFERFLPALYAEHRDH